MGELYSVILLLLLLLFYVYRISILFFGHLNDYFLETSIAKLKVVIYVTYVNETIMKAKCDHRSKFSNLSNWKEEARKKNQSLNGIRTHDLRDTGATLHQPSHEATHWEQGQFIEFISSRAVKSCGIYMK